MDPIDEALPGRQLPGDQAQPYLLPALEIFGEVACPAGPGGDGADELISVGEHSELGYPLRPARLRTLRPAPPRLAGGVLVVIAAS